MGCVYFYAIITVGVVIVGYAFYVFIVEERSRRKLERWSNTPKDEVILHGHPRPNTLPSASPITLKVECYLRLVGLKYTLDTRDTYGSDGKTPWVTVNGKHISDSEFIIDYLNRSDTKFEKDLNSGCDEKDLANARIIRVMLEEFLMWAVALERCVYGSTKRLQTVIGDQIRDFRAYDQGVNRYTQREVNYLVSKYLRDVSIVLGDKKYFGGEELCQEDCGIFGALQVLLGTPGSPYEGMMNGELSNLKEYCLRMKERVYPDWDQLIGR